MSVSFGCFRRSADSLMSRGSKAILCPLAPDSYAVSGLRMSSLRLGAGEDTRLPSFSFVSAEAPPAPRRRVRPEDMLCGVVGGVCGVHKCAGAV